MSKLVYVFTFVAFVTWMPLGCGSAPPEKLQIGTNIWPGYEPIYVARDKGYFDSIHIELNELRSATQVIQAFTGGDINVAAVTLDEAIRLAYLQQDISIVWIFNFSNGADALVTRPEITELSELAHKNIGAEQTALGQYFLSRILEEAGLERKELKVKNMDISQHEESMLKGTVDAVITFDPVLRSLSKQGFKVLFDSSDLPNEIIDVLVVKNHVLETNKTQLKQFIQGLDRIRKDIQNNFETHSAFLNRRLKLNSNEVAEVFADLVIPSPQQQLAVFSKREELQHLFERYARILNIEDLASCRCEQLVNTELLEQLSED